MNTVGWCVAWVTGCGLGLLLVGSARNSAGLEPIYGQVMLLLALASVVPAIIAWPHRSTRWICLLTAATLGGFGTALLTRPPATPADLAFYNDQPGDPRSLIIGEITGEPVLADKSQRFRFSARQIRLLGDNIPRPIEGDLYAVVARYPEYALGTRLALSGTLTAPPTLSGFDYPAYLARLGMRSYVSFPRVTDLGSVDNGILGILLSISRPAIREALQRAIPEPQAALAVGVVTGDRSQIPDEVQRVLRRSGTTHIVAISGQNIAILAGVILLVYGAIIKRRITGWAFLVSAGVIVTYALFTGASPAVVRAAIMGIILLFAPVVRRRNDPIGALAITATVMVMLDPDVLADVGFQISFAAMLGIALFAQPLYEMMARLKIQGILAIPIAVGIAAQSTTMPLIALLFGLISLVSLPATLVASVALLPLMVTGMATGILGAIFAPLAVPFGWLAWSCAAWILWWAQLWADLPFAAVDVSQFNPLWVVPYYGVLAACIWLIYSAKKAPLERGHFLTAATSVAALTLWVVFAGMVLS